MNRMDDIGPPPPVQARFARRAARARVRLLDGAGAFAAALKKLAGERQLAPTTFAPGAHADDALGEDRHPAPAHHDPPLAADMRRVEEFLATLAHELRSPLAAIQTAMQVLETLLPDDPKLQDLGRMVRRQVRHAAHLVDDLGNTASIMTGQMALDVAPVDLRDVASRALELIAPLLTERRHTLLSSFPEAPLAVDGDATRLTQLVANLLTNAAKFTPAGGRIELALEAGDGVAAIVVRDNGMGIDQAMLPRLFDRFAQASAGWQGGMGLGLPLVRRIAELHGGEVVARSDGIGRGSEFTVRLPARRPPAS
ncbi:MAG TPA: HAMP domain-containing sensor histidine kinase [Gammaproteobacteria bacterium]